MVMKAIIAVWLIAEISGLAEGTVSFNNREGDAVNAPVTFADGIGIGIGFKAQLWIGPEGTAVDRLTPLQPITTFPRVPQNVPGYINPVVIDPTPGMKEGEKAVIVMRAFNGPTWEESTCRGESLPFTVVLGERTSPPADLIGLQSFNVYCSANVQLVLKAGHAQLTWATTNAQPYTVQAVSNIIDANWVPLLTITTTNNTATFIDPIGLSNSAPRFYRVISP